MNNAQKWEQIAINRLVLWQASQKEVDALRQQRDELLAALEAIYKLANAPVFDDVQMAEQWGAVRENAWAGMQLAKGKVDEQI